MQGGYHTIKRSVKTREIEDQIAKLKQLIVDQIVSSTGRPLEELNVEFLPMSMTLEARYNIDKSRFGSKKSFPA